MRISKPLAAAVLAVVSAGAARAETLDVSSTTLLRLEQQTRGGQPAQEPELVDVAPIFEILSISARDVANPLADDLTLVAQTWGSIDLADPRWDNGTSSDYTGDVVALYVQGKFIDRHLLVRAGRAYVPTGAGRSLQLDGGEAVANLPFGVRLSGYAGSPVTQRFGKRDAITSWNPAGGDLAYGGRAGWTWGFAGHPGRGLDVGASANVVKDGGDPVREEGAVDFRLQPFRDLTFSGFGSYSLYDERVSELALRASYSVSRALFLNADARYYAPDLLLSRSSILSVFSAEERRFFGGGLSYEFFRGLRAGVNAHLSLEPNETEDESDYKGTDAEASLEWEKGPTLAGAEVLYLDALENGYWAARLFGRRELGRFFLSADVLGHLFRETVNGEDQAITGTLTAGYDIARGFSAVISGRAGVTPFLEQAFDVMAKLVYNSTYRLREVK